MDASNYCQGEGANILTIDDVRESAYIAGQIAPGSQTWLNMMYTPSSGSWTSNSPYRNWLPNEPAAVSAPSRVVVASEGGQNGWKVVGESLMAYAICEKVKKSRYHVTQTHTKL